MFFAANELPHFWQSFLNPSSRIDMEILSGLPQKRCDSEASFTFSIQLTYPGVVDTQT